MPNRHWQGRIHEGARGDHPPPNPDGCWPVHQNSLFELKNRKKIAREGAQPPSQTHPPLFPSPVVWGGGHPLPHPSPSATSVIWYSRLRHLTWLARSFGFDLGASAPGVSIRPPSHTYIRPWTLEALWFLVVCPAVRLSFVCYHLFHHISILCGGILLTYLPQIFVTGVGSSEQLF